METDMLSIVLGINLLQGRDGMRFQRNGAPDSAVLLPIASTSKSLTIAETHYSNIKMEALCMFYGIENILHYCFAYDVCMVTDHKLLVATFKKDVASLSERLQRNLLPVHQPNIRTLCKPGPQVFIAD